MTTAKPEPGLRERFIASFGAVDRARLAEDPEVKALVEKAREEGLREGMILAVSFICHFQDLVALERAAVSRQLGKRN